MRAIMVLLYAALKQRQQVAARRCNIADLMVYNVSMKRTNIYLTEPSIAKLQEMASQTGLSVAELIRRAIDAFLKKQK